VNNFDSTPMVLAQQSSDNEADTTTTRIRNVSNSSFQVRLQEEENGGEHGTETLHYVAIEVGNGSVAGRDVSVNMTARSVAQNFVDVDFGGNFSGVSFLPGMQTAFGSDTSVVRYNNLSSSGASVKIEEETSRDSEVTHTTEVVGWLVLGTRQATVSDSDTDGVADGQDACPGTAAGVEVDANGCEISSELFGVQSSGAQSAQFFVNTTEWADVHFSINGGGQQNIRMTQTGSQNVYTVNGLNSGDVISVFFTYLNPENNLAADTETISYTH